MILISHRGNINGVNKERENNPDYLEEAVKLGLDVEIDVWYIDKKFFLGHDSPLYKTDLIFLSNDKFWCHCKNIECVDQLSDTDIHYFWHQSDDITLTSKNYIWTYPGKLLLPSSIAVLPETIDNWEGLDNCSGICTDYIYFKY